MYKVVTITFCLPLMIYLFYIVVAKYPVSFSVFVDLFASFYKKTVVFAIPLFIAFFLIQIIYWVLSYSGKFRRHKIIANKLSILDKHEVEHQSQPTVPLEQRELNITYSEPNRSWIEHAYPLQQVTILLQGTRHSEREDIISQLEIIISRLKNGENTGSEHDDDFGYSFQYDAAAVGKSSFFDEAAGRK